MRVKIRLVYLMEFLVLYKLIKPIVYKVYSWGRNANRELGNGSDYPSFVPSLIQVNKNLKFVDVACGNHHSLALTDDGKVKF